jgi:hypothetical protein
MSDLGNKPWRDLKPDAQAFDEVRIVTIPRYKTSGLSGDEWRISAHIQLIRKGRVMFEKGYRNIETACAYLAAVHGEACDNGHAMFGGEGDFCDQEGCKNVATITYRKKVDYCREGHKTELSVDRVKIRRFCDMHKTRGNCGLDDADSDYEILEQQPEQPAAPPTHTKDILAAELRKAGLSEMADKAATGYYHDFLSPLATPCIQLADDLTTVGTDAAMALRERHLNGEFDATKEESDNWAKSADGQAAFSQLNFRRRK